MSMKVTYTRDAYLKLATKYENNEEVKTLVVMAKMIYFGKGFVRGVAFGLVFALCIALIVSTIL